MKKHASPSVYQLISLLNGIVGVLNPPYQGSRWCKSMHSLKIFPMTVVLDIELSGRSWVQVSIVCVCFLFVVLFQNIERYLMNPSIGICK